MPAPTGRYYFTKVNKPSNQISWEEVWLRFDVKPEAQLNTKTSPVLVGANPYRVKLETG